MWEGRRALPSAASYPPPQLWEEKGQAQAGERQAQAVERRRGRCCGAKHPEERPRRWWVCQRGGQRASEGQARLSSGEGGEERRGEVTIAEKERREGRERVCVCVYVCAC